MVNGVVNGYEKKLEIVGVDFDKNAREALALGVPDRIKTGANFADSRKYKP